MSLDEEVKFLSPFVNGAKDSGILHIPKLKAELEQRVGRKVSTSTVYQLLRRHGLSKLAQHPRTDMTVAQAWERLGQKHNST